jgi:hypothetical protein
MANIPAGTRFIGIAPQVNLTERKSAMINAETQPYFIEDISSSSGSPIFQPDIITYSGTTMGGIAIDTSNYSPIVFCSSQILAPNLLTINGSIMMNGSGYYGDSLLEVISMPLLEDAAFLTTGKSYNYAIQIEAFQLLETVDFSSLKNIGEANYSIYISDNANLTTLNIGSLEVLNGDFSVSYNPLLTSFSIANLTTFNGTFYADSNALNETTIDSILYQLADVVVLNNEIVDLSGGTNAAPSVTGATYVATLTANGCTVTTN